MSGTIQTKRKLWFWTAAIIFLLWNVMGCVSWFVDVFMLDAMMDQYSPEQQELFRQRPEWIIPVYGMAVFGALLATILLILRKALTIPVYWVSLIAIIIQFGFVLFVMDAIGKLGIVQAAAFPFVILALGGVQLWFAYIAKGKGWIG